MTSKKALLIFAKEPSPGRVKTRLIPVIGATAAAELYEKLLYQTLMKSSKLQDIKKFLCCDTENSDESRCHKFADQFGFSFHTQSGEGIGERMYHALNDVSQENDQVILIGTDCPGYSVAYLKKAFELLDTYDAIIGPASDGGYVLIGMKKTQFDLFHDIPWSTNKVLAATRERLKSLGWQWTELETLNDIDEPSDLAHVQQLLNKKEIT